MKVLELQDIIAVGQLLYFTVDRVEGEMGPTKPLLSSLSDYLH